MSHENGSGLTPEQLEAMGLSVGHVAGSEAIDSMKRTDEVAAEALAGICESSENLIECLAEPDETDPEKDHTLISVLRSIDASLKEMVAIAKQNLG